MDWKEINKENFATIFSGTLVRKRETDEEFVTGENNGESIAVYGNKSMGYINPDSMDKWEIAKALGAP